MPSNFRLGLQIVVGFAVIVAMGWYFHLFRRHAPKNIPMENLGYANQIGTACYFYAKDHGGRYPMHLNELEPAYTTNVLAFRCQSVENDGDPRYAMDWLYFGGGFDVEHPPHLLLAAPRATIIAGKEQTRVVFDGDGNIISVNEPKYQEMLAETVRQMRALDDALHPAKPAPAEASPKLAPPQ